MFSRHDSVTKGQLFASPGVVIRKSVKMKHPRHPVDEVAETSPVDFNVIESRLSSVKDTVRQQSVKEAVCHPAICSSEGHCI